MQLLGSHIDLSNYYCSQYSIIVHKLNIYLARFLVLKNLKRGISPGDFSALFVCAFNNSILVRRSLCPKKDALTVHAAVYNTSTM